MYNKKSIYVAIFIFIVLLNLRITLNPEQGSFMWILFTHIPTFIYASVLVYFGSNLRQAVSPPSKKPGRIFLHIFLAIVLIEMIVWISILFRSNYGLVGYFMAIFFLPYGYFFVKKIPKDPEVYVEEIFEKYYEEVEEEDIFDQYLKSQKKDRHYKK